MERICKNTDYFAEEKHKLGRNRLLSEAVRGPIVLFIFAQTLVKLRLFLPHKSTFFYNFLTHYDFLLVDLQLYIIHKIEIYPINLKKKKKRNSRSRLFCTDMRHHIPKLHAITV